MAAVLLHNQNNILAFDSVATYDGTYPKSNIITRELTRGAGSGGDDDDDYPQTKTNSFDVGYRWLELAASTSSSLYFLGAFTYPLLCDCFFVCSHTTNDDDCRTVCLSVCLFDCGCQAACFPQSFHHSEAFLCPCSFAVPLSLSLSRL